MTLKLPLYHGGVMLNYRCTAACRHCLYACSPGLGEGCMSRDMAREVSALLAKGRIGSVHIGGGEPFLEFDGLLALTGELRDADIQLDYVETNAFWADSPSARERIRALRDGGVPALCISLDPFHAEYVPWDSPLRLARLCDEAGMDYFVWKKEFIPALSKLEKGKIHSRAAMEAVISPGYIAETAAAYGIRLGGRAVTIDEAYTAKKSVDDLMADAAGGRPCGDLLSSGHFHVDMAGYFLPPLCTGLRLPLAELLEGVMPGKYPVYETLCEKGPAALFDFARFHGFGPEKSGYTSVCNFCFYIRRFLSGKGFMELDREHYEEALKY